MAERHRLHAIHGSHPCVAVERVLELKGQEWDVTELVPPTQALVMRVRFGAPTVPAIRFADGERVQGSRAIMRRLDERYPDPPIYPADPTLRARADEAERWGDEVLQAVVRRLLFAGFRRNPGAMHTYQAGARLRFPRVVTRAAAPAIIAGEWRVHRMSHEQVARDIADLPAMFDRVDGWIEEGVLGADAPGAADFQIAASLRLMLTLEDVRIRFGERPAARLAMRLVPHYDGDLPAGALHGPVMDRS